MTQERQMAFNLWVSEIPRKPIAALAAALGCSIGKAHGIVREQEKPASTIATTREGDRIYAEVTIASEPATMPTMPANPQTQCPECGSLKVTTWEQETTAHGEARFGHCCDACGKQFDSKKPAGAYGPWSSPVVVPLPQGDPKIAHVPGLVDPVVINDCQQCGGEGMLGAWGFEKPDHTREETTYDVQCEDCANQTKQHPTEIDAISAWNAANPVTP